MARIITTKEFIEKAKSIHGDKYCYDKVIYKKAREKVIIICKRHKKRFRQTPDSHLRGSGCPICGKENHLLSQESEKTPLLAVGMNQTLNQP